MKRERAAKPGRRPGGAAPAVVGIGASAGGLEAFTQVLRALPTDTGMAFVLVQHLAPNRASLLADILSRSTRMPVEQVEDEPLVRPDRVYVIPPTRNMTIAKGRLKLVSRERSGFNRPIDVFLRALADDLGPRAIGVILSGTADDGTLGLEAIKAHGGITFAQDGTALQPGMPQSAIDTGCVDFVLPPERIASELARIARHPYVARLPETPPADAEHGARIVELVRNATGVDFTHYKATTLHRRITRRMLLHGLESWRDYAKLLDRDAAEVHALHQDILIHVTSFFRDPESFDALGKSVFPRLLRGRTRDDPLRVWAVGCSTGEEAYSLAIALTEAAEAAGSRAALQVFATDLNEKGIERARTGFYPDDIAQDVSPERLRRFFTKVDGRYRVTKSIRELCVFARHDALADPPFSRIDLISCRNMLIYLEPVLQQRMIGVFHYSLRPGGFLWLGTSESIGAQMDLFDVVDARHKIFATRSSAARAGAPRGWTTPSAAPRAAAPAPVTAAASTAEMHREADRTVLTRFGPPGVLVNADLEILQFRGETSAYLTPAPGRASLQILKMTRPGLLVGLRSALEEARATREPASAQGLRVKTRDEVHDVDVHVLPMSHASGGCFLVLFEESLGRQDRERGRRKRPKPGGEPAKAEESEREISRLTQELAATREYLQSVIEQQEAANEELQSANEEVQSSNEELQSFNEELETSKEEIQSSNEELATVNDELKTRNQELAQSNSDLVNLIGSAQLAIVMLSRDLRIRRFTLAAEKLLNLIPADVGRPFTDIKIPFEVAGMDALLASVIDGGETRDAEARDTKGRWFSLRAGPYRTHDLQVDGVVLAFVDVDVLKRAQSDLRARVEELALADRRRNEFLAMLAHELRNPLAPLNNAVSLLGTPHVDRVSRRSALAMMRRQVRHMARLVGDLLDVSRITQGTIKLHKERIDAGAVLRESVDAGCAHAGARGQTIELAGPEGPAFVEGDADRLSQVFGNLLQNACKFSHPGGAIAVSSAVADGVFEARFVDHGSGMDQATLDSCFDMFVQGDTSLERRANGLGIGLTLVKQLVELHGGAVSARSEGPGRGSEFVVRLPIAEGGGKPAKKKSAPASRDRSGRRVLVVDDSTDAADSLASLLRARGYEVVSSHDGASALAAAAKTLPHAVVLDLAMPGMDGFETARRLRRQPGGRECVLIAHSGYDTESERKLARAAGFDHYLPKPAGFPEFDALLGAKS